MGVSAMAWCRFRRPPIFDRAIASPTILARYPIDVKRTCDPASSPITTQFHKSSHPNPSYDPIDAPAPTDSNSPFVPRSSPASASPISPLTSTSPNGRLT